eukprot:5968139-Amphidinium_carterae.1
MVWAYGSNPLPRTARPLVDFNMPSAIHSCNGSIPTQKKNWGSQMARAQKAKRPLKAHNLGTIRRITPHPK